MVYSPDYGNYLHDNRGYAKTLLKNLYQLLNIIELKPP
jgi:hypothetical protein